MNTQNNKKLLPALAFVFGVAALSGCADQTGTYHCTGANAQDVSVKWGKYYATATVKENSGDQYEVTAMNRFMLAKQHVNKLGGSCANWQPE